MLHDKGPLLIVAGAGTGKTTVITQRIVNLIEKKLALPEEILAVTFTEKASSEFDLDYYKSMGNPTKFIQSLISHFSHCKDQEVYPENYLEYANTLKASGEESENDEIKRIKDVFTFTDGKCAERAAKIIINKLKDL